MIAVGHEAGHEVSLAFTEPSSPYEPRRGNMIIFLNHPLVWLGCRNTSLPSKKNRDFVGVPLQQQNNIEYTRLDE